MKLLMLMLILAAGLSSASCLGRDTASDDLRRCLRRDQTMDEDCVDQIFFGYFQRDAKTLQEKGLPVYWLGREFTATPRGLTFRGPYGVGFGGEVEGGGILMEYVSGGTDPALEITIYSPAAWELVIDRLLNPRLLSNEGKATRQTVTVKGREAELISIPQFSRPVGELRLIVDLDEVVVVAEAALVQGSGGTDYGLFVKNPDLLVQVMQNLRPYPQ